MNIILYYYMHHIILPELYLSYIAINGPFEIVYSNAVLTGWVVDE